MRSKRLIVVFAVVAAALLFSSFAFAQFTTGLNITGTVTGEGHFDAYFDEAAGTKLYNKNDIAVTVQSVENDDEGDAKDKLKLKVSLPSTDAVDIRFNVTVMNDSTAPAVIDVFSSDASGTFIVSTTQKVTAEAGKSVEVEVRIRSNGTIANQKYEGITLDIVARQPEIDQPSGPSHNHSGN